MKILFIINSLDPGGAEKTSSLLTNYLSKDHEVILVTRKDKDTFFYPTSSRIKVVPIICWKKNRLKILFHYANSLRKLIRKENPDAVISFLTESNILAIISSLLANKKNKLIISERTNLANHKLPLLVNLLRRLLYPFASKLVIQTEDIFHLASNLIAKEKIAVINNPIDLDIMKKNSLRNFRPERAQYILSIGRFSKEKGQHILIEAFFLIAERFPEKYLILIGEGPEKASLQKKISSSPLGGRIIFLGTKINIIDYLSNAELFVLPSLYEGFPNVLAEALSCGTPSISFDCPSGPSSLLTGLMSQYLVNDISSKSLADKMIYVLDKKSVKRDFQEFAETVRMKLSLEKISKKWIDLILN